MISIPALLVGLLLTVPVAVEPLARIPFELTGDHTFIEVELNDRTLSFVFDTGAGGVALNRKTAQRLRRTATGSGSAVGAAGAITIPLVHGLTMQLDRLQLTGITAGLIELDHLEERVGRPLDGIIGRDVLNRRLVLLDHDRHVLEIHDRDSFSFEAWGEPCALKVHGPLEVKGAIRLMSGETLQGTYLVDTGAGLFLSLNSPFVRKHDLSSRVGPTYERTGHALTGIAIADRVGRVAGLRFCGHDFPTFEIVGGKNGVPIVLSGATGGVQARRGRAGLIGNRVLTRFNMLFDLEKRRFYLKPNDGWNAPVRSDSSGLRLARRPDGTFVIDEIVVPSPAADLGLVRGDRIRAVDNEDVAEMSLAALRDLLKQPGQAVHFEVVRDGTVLAVVLNTRSLWTSSE